MMDKRFVVTDLRNVQRLKGWNDEQISGYEIHTHTFEQEDPLFEQLYRISVESEGTIPLMVLDTVEEYPMMFDWLKAHDVNAVVIITIMFVVSLLSALSALLIMLLERTRTIGILKALGMSNGAIQRIFLYRSLWVATIGVVIGDLLGIGLCLAQKYLHLIKLDSEGYFLSEMPIELNGWYIVAINLGIVALLMVALTLPTLIISKIKPDKTIRYQ
jgi:lipoprotein-releasing system permease protein